MTEKPSDCPEDGGVAEMTPAFSGKLGTLQRNALCKIFDRPEFSPAEVAALGYRRLQQSAGIGKKGLREITAWLNAHGLELKPSEPPPTPRPPAARKTQRSIEHAVRLLRTHGYLVEPVGWEAAD